MAIATTPLMMRVKDIIISAYFQSIDKKIKASSDGLLKKSLSNVNENLCDRLSFLNVAGVIGG
jgi:hypothetical protein